MLRRLAQSRVTAAALRGLRTLDLTDPGDAHQRTSVTWSERYPVVFDFLSHELGRVNREDARILSYGCSTGEECFSLRRRLPDASIVGVDISRRNLRACRRRNRDDRISFQPSRPGVLRGLAPFDAMLAMSVLCRWPETESVDDCSKIYPFERFQSALGLLDGVLEPGGLLVVYNANFRVEDSSLGSAYLPIPVPGLEAGFVHLFGPDNRKLAGPGGGACVFRKR